MIIPSIDLMDGKAVQLKQGREKMLERDSPLELAKYFNRFGEIAVIDLDAAMKKGSNKELISELCQIADCRVGGGIRDIESAKELISLGAAKIIIGSSAFENDQINHEFLEELITVIDRQQIIIAIDAYEGEIVTQAWKHKTGLNLFDVTKQIEPYASEFLFTCVEKEGCMQGTDLETVRKLKGTTSNKITLAGGITTIEEIQELANLGVNSQLGMAIYTGKLKLEEAFIESLNWKSELIPTVTCDTNGQVLMVAYSNKASIQKTFETEKMWYFSRSRNKLWQKGETSNNIQDFIQFRTDCDSDTLLATVKQTGVACHLGSYSCFGNKKFSLNELHQVIQNRFKNPPPGSYTATLTDTIVKEKLMEEAQEVVEAKTRDEIIWEAADVLYFLTVIMAKNDVTYKDVLNELRRRRKK
ncbi:bifunctional phosphoribosyl-AMP cyclohydrolase/phosphoribosyl-ATP diphosphatase HisIE [candidate division KSB1 bacterium]|nr:bifunctional phosphoribosyl-AMP cyclohydrolase/phosphoribosyl-ATP diphosphatase HisIE [candidate division KSB1 bacterium]MBL7095063.1 bifunctional phosphoribosyl-AMP cyclohydrolase/phosphoribosyl-ATP diphosphatase HisIE [candidate division KSB1 bacterium]